MKTLVLLFSLLLSSVASAEWIHFSLQTAEGVEIKLDHTRFTPASTSGCYKCSLTTVASSLWIHVKGPNLKPTDKVRVILNNFSHYSFERYESLEGRELDLVPTEEGTFSVEVKDLPIYANGYPGQRFYRQEIAVVVNGQWLKNKDDLSKSDIGFTLYWK